VAEGDGEGLATGAHTGTPDVFISYASQDASVADAVVKAFERQGLTCWIAPRNVTPGAFYGDEIVHAIDAAKAVSTTCRWMPYRNICDSRITGRVPIMRHTHIIRSSVPSLRTN
jgi:hypothetical protein